MATTDPGPQPSAEWRDRSRPLEEPAYLGRPFPGGSRTTQARPSRVLGLLIGLVALILTAAFVYFSQGNTLAGLVAVGALLVIGAAAVVVIRKEVRQVIKGERR